MKSILPTLALATALPFGLAGCVVVDSQGHITREEKRFSLTGLPDVRLTTFDGAIEIRSGEGNRVVVEIEKRGATKEALDDLKVDTKQDGNRIEVDVRKPAHEVVFFGVGRMSTTAKLIVTMPRDGNVTARSGDGSIRIEHVHGRLELRTGDGSIRAIDVGGQLTLATGDGSVTLEEVAGDVDVDTGDGSVSVAGKPSAMKLHTGDGSITVRALTGTTMKDDWSMTTGDGGVAVYLPSDFGAELDAHTGDGSIRNELQLSNDDGDKSRRSLKGRLGAGGKLLKIRTGDGSIRLNTSLGRFANRPRLSNRLFAVRRRVLDARLPESIPALAALAASAAMQAILRLHAGQRQLERHAKFDPLSDDIPLVQRCKGRLDGDRRAKPERQRARHGGEKVRRRIRKRVACERPEQHARDAVLRHVDRRLRQQDDVPALQINVFVRRVERGRRAADRPMRLGKHVAHVESQLYRRLDLSGEWRAGEEPRRHRALFGLPCETDADVERAHRSLAHGVRDEHGAVEAAGKEDGAIIGARSRRFAAVPSGCSLIIS
jgi:hypothetical protein